MKSKSKKPSFGVIVILYLLAALFLGYGIYRVYCSVEYVLSYDSNAAVSTANILQYVVSDSAMYFGFAIVIFAAAHLMNALRKLQFPAVSATLENEAYEPVPETTPGAEMSAEPISGPEPKTGLEAELETGTITRGEAEPKTKFEREQEEEILPTSVFGPEQAAEMPAPSPVSGEAESLPNEPEPLPELEENEPVLIETVTAHNLTDASFSIDSADAKSPRQFDEPVAAAHIEQQQVFTKPTPFTDTEPVAEARKTYTSTKTESAISTKRASQDFHETNTATHTRQPHAAVGSERFADEKKTPQGFDRRMDTASIKAEPVSVSNDPALEMSEAASVESAFGRLKSAFKKSSPAFEKTESAAETRKAYEFKEASSPTPTGSANVKPSRQFNEPAAAAHAERPHELAEPEPVIELEFEPEPPAKSNTDTKFDLKYETVTITGSDRMPDNNDNAPDSISIEQRLSDTIRLTKKDQEALSSAMIRSIFEDK